MVDSFFVVSVLDPSSPQAVEAFSNAMPFKILHFLIFIINHLSFVLLCSLELTCLLCRIVCVGASVLGPSFLFVMMISVSSFWTICCVLPGPAVQPNKLLFFLFLKPTNLAFGAFI